MRVHRTSKLVLACLDVQEEIEENPCERSGGQL